MATISSMTILTNGLPSCVAQPRLDLPSRDGKCKPLAVDGRYQNLRKNGDWLRPTPQKRIFQDAAGTCPHCFIDELPQKSPLTISPFLIVIKPIRILASRPVGRNRTEPSQTATLAPPA